MPDAVDSPVDPLRILVVDQDPDGLDRLEAFLGDLFGDLCRVTRAGDTETALAALGADDHHLVIGEERIPGGGVELFREARRLRPDAVRILVTEGLEESQFVAAINSGEVYRFVSKPWSGPDMEECIRNALDWRQHGRAMRLLLHEQRRTHLALLGSLSALERTQQQMIHVERLATVGRLTSGIIHEVRNQLTALLGVFATLRTADGRTGELAEEGHRLVRTLSARISTIESFARGGSWTYDMEDVAVGEVLEQVRSFHGLDGGAGGLVVAMRPEVGGHRFRLDAAKVAHAILALARVGQDRYGGGVRVRADIRGDASLVLLLSSGTPAPPPGQSGLLRIDRKELDPSLELVQMIVEAHGGQVVYEGLDDRRDFARIVLPRR